MLSIKRNKILYFPIFVFLIFAITNIDILFSINAAQITDRFNYQDNITNGDFLYTLAINAGFPLILFTEPLFKSIYYSFFILNIDPQFAIKLIIFIMITATFYILNKKTNISPFWIILIVLSPTVIVNYVMTIRQGFATVLFLIVLYYINGNLKNIFLSIIPLFHYSFFIVLPIYFFSIKKNRNSNPYKIIILVIIYSALISILILKLTSLLNLSYFENYIDDSKFKFGFGLVFWFFILILFMSEGKQFLQKNLFETLCVAFYVGSVSFFNPFSRILQAVSIIILISGFSLTGWRKQTFKLMLFLFVLYLLIPILYNYNLGSMMLNTD
jgi:hypothetical protein